MTPASAGWRTGRGRLDLTRPVVMGILNVTPDSFSDGGELPNPEAALRRGRTMVEAGAGILDIGGESTRPGAERVPVEEELRRVLPVVRLLDRELPVPLSVDTRKAEVARRAVDAGAAVVNDVSGLRFDPAMAGVVAESGAGLVLMHMRGIPADMRERARYRDVVGEVADELGEAVTVARTAGVPDDAIVVDPGIGFAKTALQSLRLVRELERIVAMGFPVMVGPSRKSFLGEVLGVPADRRVVGSAVACALARERGAALFRVHDVVETTQALAVADAVAGRGRWDPRSGRGVDDEDDRGAGPEGSPASEEFRR